MTRAETAEAHRTWRALACLCIVALTTAVAAVSAEANGTLSTPSLSQLGFYGRPSQDTTGGFSLGSRAFPSPEGRRWFAEPVTLTGNPHLVPEASIPTLRQEEGIAEQTSTSSAQALLPALMSAVVPGTGQLRNGTVGRGLIFIVIEITGWAAYFSFDDNATEKEGEMDTFSNRYWSYDRYHSVAPYPDSCDVYGCPKNMWSQEADSLIVDAGDHGGTRYRQLLTRDSYACGWTNPTTRGSYQGLWDDREDQVEAKKVTGRVIFLNHLVSAAEAFMTARRMRLKVGDHTEVGLRLRGLPYEVQPQLVFTTRFD